MTTESVEHWLRKWAWWMDSETEMEAIYWASLLDLEPGMRAMHLGLSICSDCWISNNKHDNCLKSNDLRGL